MPQEVINCIHTLFGRNASGITIYDRNNNITPDDEPVETNDSTSSPLPSSNEKKKYTVLDEDIDNHDLNGPVDTNVNNHPIA